jgi:hypothetical protein
MPRGGYRPGSGRKAGSATMDSEDRAALFAAERDNLSPLDYMLSVMNDPAADDGRRDRMAQAAAPYVHAKPGDAPKGKKEERQEAADKAAVGKFAVPAAPSIN